MGVQKKILTRDPSFYGAGTVTGADGKQKTILGGTGTLALGVPGNIFDASPARIHTAVLPDDADIGTFFPDEGIIVNPREYALKGEAGNPLAPSLTLSAGMVASFMTFGHVVVYLADAEVILAAMDGSYIVGKPAEFSATSTYAVGDIVSYTNSGTTQIYKCKTEVSSAGDWATVGANFQQYGIDPDDTDLCVLEVNGLK